MAEALSYLNTVDGYTPTSVAGDFNAFYAILNNYFLQKTWHNHEEIKLPIPYPASCMICHTCVNTVQYVQQYDNVFFNFLNHMRTPQPPPHNFLPLEYLYPTRNYRTLPYCEVPWLF